MFAVTYAGKFGNSLGTQHSKVDSLLEEESKNSNEHSQPILRDNAFSRQSKLFESFWDTQRKELRRFYELFANLSYVE